MRPAPGSGHSGGSNSLIVSFRPHDRVHTVVLDPPRTASFPGFLWSRALCGLLTVVASTFGLPTTTYPAVTPPSATRDAGLVKPWGEANGRRVQATRGAGSRAHHGRIDCLRSRTRALDISGRRGRAGRDAARRADHLLHAHPGRCSAALLPLARLQCGAGRRGRRPADRVADGRAGARRLARPGLWRARSRGSHDPRDAAVVLSVLCPLALVAERVDVPGDPALLGGAAGMACWSRPARWSCSWLPLCAVRTRHGRGAHHAGGPGYGDVGLDRAAPSAPSPCGYAGSWPRPSRC